MSPDVSGMTLTYPPGLWKPLLPGSGVTTSWPGGWKDVALTTNGCLSRRAAFGRSLGCRSKHRRRKSFLRNGKAERQREEQVGTGRAGAGVGVSGNGGAGTGIRAGRPRRRRSVVQIGPFRGEGLGNWRRALGGGNVEHGGHLRCELAPAVKAGRSGEDAAANSPS